MTALPLPDLLRSENGFTARVRSFLLLSARLAVLLAAYVVVVRWLSHTGHLALHNYAQPALFVEVGRRVLSSPLLLLLTAALLLFRFRSVGHPWHEYQFGRELRVFITLVALVCAWAFSTYDYNLYFDRAHTLDRLLLVALAVLIYWKPVFIFPFALLLYTIVWQFDYPLVGQYPWTEMNLPVRLLAMFAALFLLNLVTGRRKTEDYIFLLCCLIPAFYWGSGIGKFQLNWISHRQLHNLLFGAYSAGWLSFLEPSAIVSLVNGIARFTLPMMVFTLVVEWGALLFLSRRLVALALLIGFILFHLGVFAISGMFFWKWIFIEAALIALFIGRLKSLALPIFTPGHFLISLVLIGGGVIWFKPTNLSWYDTRLSYAYRFEGIGESGARYALPTPTFTPYSDMFTLGNFGYLNPGPQLTHIFGVTTDRWLARTLLSVSSLEQVEALEQSYADSRFDPESSAAFDEFIQRFIGHLNQRKSKRTLFSILQAPPHLWSFSRQPTFTGVEPLRKVIVYQHTWLYDGGEFREIRSKPIRLIDIPETRVVHPFLIEKTGSHTTPEGVKNQ